MYVTIIGAGPIGCFAGYHLARAGHRVEIYENHAQIGSPIQCTGLLTHDFDQFNLPTESFLINTLQTIEVHSPGKHKLRIAQKEYLVCRIKFDTFFADLARREGAKIFVNHSFQRKEKEELIIKDSVNRVEKRVTPDIVIAADGPLSPTAKAYGLYHSQRENFYGIQATVEGVFEEGCYQAHFGNEVCPGLFAWIVPESATTARVGVATKQNTKYYFDKFMTERGYVAKAIQAGTIPVYDSKQMLRKDNCYVLGDASSFVKATTLGGLIPGLMQAQIVAKSIINDENVEQRVKSIRLRLGIHLWMHRIFEKFSDADWNRLIGYMSQPRIQRILEKHTRENPLPIMMKALMCEPRFLYFGKYLMYSNGE